MKLKQILLCIGIITVIGNPLAQAAKQPLNPKIDKYVQDKFKSNKQFNNRVFVILKSQADLSGADSLVSRADKKRYVYNTLRNTALATQGPLVDYLQSKKLRFRQFYIENMIAVENPTADLVNILAARPDVARIMGNPLVKLKLPHNPVTLASRAVAGGPEQNIVRIGATKVWDNYHVRGEGIVVAGQDTGVEWDHPALIHQYRGSTANGVDHN